jgi:hypothetical protein
MQFFLQVNCHRTTTVKSCGIDKYQTIFANLHVLKAELPREWNSFVFSRDSMFPEKTYCCLF